MIMGKEWDTQTIGTENGSYSMTSTSLGVEKMKGKMIIPVTISLLPPVLDQK